MIRQASVIVLVLQLLVSSLQPAEAQKASREDEVRAAVSAFGRAFVEADVLYLRSRLTEDYVHINGRSGNVLHRPEWLGWMTSRRAELTSGELIINEYNVDGVMVHIYGETAVVTGIVKSSGIRGGEPFTSRIRFTNVWVRQGGTWLRAAFHDSPAPEA
jgi:ketosteroid isomerase-like protein